MQRGKPLPRATVLLAVLVLAVVVTNVVGCVCTADWCGTFRDSANPSFQTGAASIAGGLINGVFAVLNTGSDVLGTSGSTTPITTFTQGGDPNNP